MNKFFTEIGPTLSKQIHESNVTYLSSLEKSEHSAIKLSEWRPLNMEEIEILRD